MSVTRVIRYETKVDRAEENEVLIRDVFAELAQDKPDGLQYNAFRLQDGVSFMHIATIDNDDNPLLSSAAFAAFQVGIHDRCVDGPNPVAASIIGSYNSGA